jgi:putative (di)nucleoside polyphosphate hydrolase
MSKFAHLPYRLGVGMIVLNHHGEAFVAKRIDMTSEAWQMPQGGVDDGEPPRAAAMRELREEIGTDDVTILAQSADFYFYDLPDDLIPKVWGGKYRGQKQIWFAMRLNGGDELIDIGTDHAEFSEWKWVPVAQLPEVIVPFKRALYAALVEEFGHLATAR